MKHQGKRLRQYFDDQGIKYGTVCERLKCHRNTLRQWMMSDMLTMDIFERLAKEFNDIMESFPDVEWKNMKWELSEPRAHYGSSPPESRCKQDLEDLRDRYIRLLERHNTFMEKYTDQLSAR